MEQLQLNNRVQKECGLDNIHLYSPQELNTLYPWLKLESELELESESDSSNNIVLGSGSHGGLEGYFDPWAYLMALKKKV